MDTVPIPDTGNIIHPKDYIKDQGLLAELVRTRKTIFEDYRSNFGRVFTYAYDLYVNTGFAYKKLKHNHYEEIKSLLISNKLDWYFLSGGYGIIHALEPARKYDATFSRAISYKKNIPFTSNIWKNLLPKIIDDIISQKKPKYFYTFGSQDYTQHVKETNLWKKLFKSTISCKIFESTGSSGVHWISKMLNDLANCIELKKIDSFDTKYSEYTKQGT